MGKEVRIGVAVIGVLLIALGLVVYRQLFKEPTETAIAEVSPEEVAALKREESLESGDPGARQEPIPAKRSSGDMLSRVSMSSSRRRDQAGSSSEGEPTPATPSHMDRHSSATNSRGNSHSRYDTGADAGDEFDSNAAGAGATAWSTSGGSSGDAADHDAGTQDESADQFQPTPADQTADAAGADVAGDDPFNRASGSSAHHVADFDAQEATDSDGSDPQASDPSDAADPHSGYQRREPVAAQGYESPSSRRQQPHAYASSDPSDDSANSPHADPFAGDEAADEVANHRSGAYQDNSSYQSPARDEELDAMEQARQQRQTPTPAQSGAYGRGHQSPRYADANSADPNAADPNSFDPNGADVGRYDAHAADPSEPNAFAAPNRLIHDETVVQSGTGYGHNPRRASQPIATQPISSANSGDDPGAGDTGPSDSDAYRVQPQESFWSIAKTLYGSSAYAKVLHEHNRDRYPRADQLQAGDIISAPDAAYLQKRYPQLVPRQQTASAPRKVTGSARSASMTRTTPPGTRPYVVEEGDTLFDIARYELGKASRWSEIFELNRDQLGEDFDHLKPGTTLFLPQAGSDSRTTQPRQPLRR